MPRQPYIALCTGTALFFFDPRGNPLGQRQTVAIQPTTGATSPSGATGLFAPTGYVQFGAAGPSTCVNYSWNNDLTAVAGLDTYPSGDTVPASLDVTTGTVTDAVTPPNHGGFDATATTRYIDAEFDPYSNALWYVRNLDAGCEGEELFGPHFQRVLTHDPVCASDINLPLLVFDGPNSPLPELAEQPPNTKYQTYALNVQLPTTNYHVGFIRRADSGSAGAFVAYPSDGSTQPPQLFTVSANGGEPTVVSTLTGFDTNSVPDVLRYHDR